METSFFTGERNFESKLYWYKRLHKFCRGHLKLQVILEKRDFETTFTGTFETDFVGTFETTFTGNFIGALINAGTETIETYTLYVRTA